MAMDDDAHRLLKTLRIEHRELDGHIKALEQQYTDTLTITRLKKRKLLLKEMITKYESLGIPDLNA